MKNLLLICFLLFTGLHLSAQDKDGHRERIKALKTAYITEGLSLSSKDAQKFWPIYNEFEEKRRNLYRREHADIDDLQCISEEKAENMLQEYVNIEREDYLLQKKFFSDLRTIFTAKQIIQLKKVEDEFNRKLFKEYRERHSKNNQS